jgi:hypothetical protein
MSCTSCCPRGIRDCSRTCWASRSCCVRLQTGLFSRYPEHKNFSQPDASPQSLVCRRTALGIPYWAHHHQPASGSQGPGSITGAAHFHPPPPSHRDRHAAGLIPRCPLHSRTSRMAFRFSFFSATDPPPASGLEGPVQIQPDIRRRTNQLSLWTSAHRHGLCKREPSCFGAPALFEREVDTPAGHWPLVPGCFGDADREIVLPSQPPLSRRRGLRVPPGRERPHQGAPSQAVGALGNAGMSGMSGSLSSVTKRGPNHATPKALKQVHQVQLPCAIVGVVEIPKT